MLRFISSIGLVVVAGIIQQSSIFIYGVKPCISLVLLLGLSLVNRSWIDRFMLAVTSAFMLSAYPGFDPQSVIFLGVSLLTMFLIDVMPWIRSINLVVAVIIATIFINLYQFNLMSVLLELLYNVIISLAFFWIISKNVDEIKKEK